MSIPTLFDKSFLQSLSVDESVWFDRFFMAIVSPLFYVETLADLEKSGRAGRTPEQEVAVIAEKFPEVHGIPNVHHTRLLQADLFGDLGATNGKPCVPPGRLVKVDGKTGVVFEPSPEGDAFSRWQRGEFLELERVHAKVWRTELASLDLHALRTKVRQYGITGKTCRSLRDARRIADAFVQDKENAEHLLGVAVTLARGKPHTLGEVLERWRKAGVRSLPEHAPFAAHLMTVEVFFQLALAADLISSERPSNHADMAYLFYLPFCKIFVSSDDLHRRCAPLFLTEDQSFVWGPDLKADLAALNAFYARLPEAAHKLGLDSFASRPPTDGDFLVSRLWDKHLPGWRERHSVSLPLDPVAEKKLVAELKKFTDARPLKEVEADFDPEAADVLAMQRRVNKKKGSWWQLPEDLKVSPDEQASL
jgi:hypothetical protein